MSHPGGVVVFQPVATSVVVTVATVTGTMVAMSAIIKTMLSASFVGRKVTPSWSVSSALIKITPVKRRVLQQ
jgi:hypothetical protein